MGNLIITSTEGGFSTKSPTSLFENQCTTATNVEWVKSKCGERRLGATAISKGGLSALVNIDNIFYMYRHLPTTDLGDAELWAFGLEGSTVKAFKKTTSWAEVTIVDAFTVDGTSEYQMQCQTLHGKLFIAYNSSVDRLHCWDGSVWRRTGHGTPAAPTAADAGGDTDYSGTRYYRVRYTTQSGGVTLRRGEAGAVLTHTPDGAHTSVTITKPASISENETHWELEASTDNINFYVLATTVVGTTTVSDTTVIATGYGAYELAPDAGDYTAIPSVKFLSADDDRLMGGGSWETAAYASRVVWTPVLADPNGVGNDERLEWDTDPYRDLDNYEGGALTNLSSNVNGYIYTSKFSHFYQLVRTRKRAQAYDVIPITKQRGALPFSFVPALDNAGIACLFAVDPDVGPVYVGGRAGIETCGSDLYQFWQDNRSTILSYKGGSGFRGLFFPEKKQVRWWQGNATLSIVLHTQHMRATDEGFRGGWSSWTGNSSASVLAMCLFSSNIDSNTTRDTILKPFIGRSDGSIWITDTGSQDNGSAYIAEIASRQFVRNNLIDQFEIMEGALLAKAISSSQITVAVYANKSDLGLVGKAGQTVSLAGLAGDGTWVVRKVDDIGNAESNTVYVYWGDGALTQSAQWQIEQIVLKDTGGQGA